MKGLSGLKSVVLVGAMLMIIGNYQLSSKAYAEEVLELEEVIVGKGCGCDNQCGDQCRCKIKEREQ